MFYLLFLLLGYELYRRHNLDLFHYFMFTCVYGFFLSYVGYLFLPAVGPRFTLHDFAGIEHDLPGLWLTPYLRWFVNAGESVPAGATNGLALAVAQRDVFPSGHTMMTLVLMYLGAKYRVRVRWVIYVTGTLLIVATVYERYHYVIDLIAGALFMLLCVATSRRLYDGIKRRLRTMESRFPPL
jgi:membrane-associated phospholipid phosphatase